MQTKTFYIDPQSYNNLARYDHCLLSNIDGEVVYFHNVKYQLGERPCKDSRAVFSYSDKRGVRKLLSYAQSMCKVAWAVVRERPRVVHVQWFRLFAVDAPFVLLANLLGARVVFTAHNVLPHNPRRGDRRAYAWYYRTVDAIVVHTERSVDELQRLFGVASERIHVIPHGLLPQVDDENAVAQRMRELSANHSLHGKIVFASLGYQNYYKGIDLIQDVWTAHEALCHGANCRLLVVGKVQNADVSRLQQCENAIVVDELVSDTDFEAYLRLATVALLPYRAISQSGVLLTALRAGVPVVVSDVGGLTDPLRYGKVGWCIGEPTAENLANTMLKLVSNPAATTAVSGDSQAFAAVSEAFSWHNIGYKTTQLYQSFYNNASH